jgi:hypothetical protein
MHYDIVAAILPTIAVLTGILLNRNDYSKLDARLSSEIGRLDTRIGALENRFHSDMMLVIGKLTELEVRVARLEEKASR